MVSLQYVAPCCLCSDLDVLWVKRKCLLEEVGSHSVFLLFFEDEAEANEGGAVGAVAGENRFEGSAGFGVVLGGLIVDLCSCEGDSDGIGVSGVVRLGRVGERRGGYFWKGRPERVDSEARRRRALRETSMQLS